MNQLQIEFQGIINFRLACKKNFLSNQLISKPVIYRSGRYLQDIKICSQILKSQYGIESYIDLRSFNEIFEDKVYIELSKQGIEWKNFPFHEENDFFRKINYPSNLDYIAYYINLIESNKLKIKELLFYIAYSAYSRFLISCYAGKDRTGIIIMFLMKILGISEENICDDFEMSALYLRPNIAYFKNNWTSRGLTQEQYENRLTPSKEIIKEVLHYLEKSYGSAINYLIKIGLKEVDFLKIKTKFFSYSA